jgi:hypothetical protein
VAGGGRVTSAAGAYRAYLLRLWRTAEGQWRATLEDAHSGERLAFATLDQLAAFLARQTEAVGREERCPLNADDTNASD